MVDYFKNFLLAIENILWCVISERLQLFCSQATYIYFFKIIDHCNGLISLINDLSAVAKIRLLMQELSAPPIHNLISSNIFLIVKRLLFHSYGANFIH